MSFHPDSNLPDCMMPDGGECCAGHAAVCEDWHKQRREIERLQRRVTVLEMVIREELFSDECGDDANAMIVRHIHAMALGVKP